ncbi:hypothetical protein [uncultured Jatrophihabitans sp.]|uniref:hypothetical protein n=1 Tax=uncultured Jatrophihabitans sp. TaxID=1610747 RepID=UPI0035CA004D
MSEFAGSEYRVGEIRALRTFRINSGGLLLPLFGDRPWQDGPNAACCTAADANDFAHQGGIPDPDCRCGFYAYADEHAAAQFPEARHVLAVVKCWGRVVAGTRGLRCQYAAVEGLWMDDRVHEALARAVVSNYPTLRRYATREQMLDRHPLDQLGCYEPYVRAGRVSALVRAACVVGVVVFGLLSSLSDLPWPWPWKVSTGLLLLLLATAGGHAERTHRNNQRHRLLVAGLALWIVGSFFGVAGSVLIQLPLVLLVTLAASHKLGEHRRARRYPEPA